MDGGWCRSSEKTLPSRCYTSKMNTQDEATTEASPPSHILARCSSTIVPSRLSDLCGTEGRLPPEEQLGFRAQHSTSGVIFVVRRSQKRGRPRGFHCTSCALPTRRKCTIASTVLFCRTCSPTTACHDRRHPPVQRWHGSACATA